MAAQLIVNVLSIDPGYSNGLTVPFTSGLPTWIVALFVGSVVPMLCVCTYAVVAPDCTGVTVLPCSRSTICPNVLIGTCPAMLTPASRVVTIDGPHLALYTNPGAAVHAIVGFMRESA